jgi:hypothetical protein
MLMKPVARLAAALALILGLCAFVKPDPKLDKAAAKASACDRACLEGFLDQYLEAMAANDPSKVKLSPHLKLTENGAILTVGDGLWRTATGLGTYRFKFSDPQTHQAGAVAVVLENGVEQLVGLRLKVEDRAVTEAEMIVARKGEGQTLVTDSLKTPLPELLIPVPEAGRSSRAELTAIADKYFTAIEKGDGSIAPFAPDGFRIENGVRTCNDPGPIVSTGGASQQFPNLRAMHCADQLSTKIFTYIKEIRPRRFPVADTERGLVAGIVRFNHPGRPTSVDVPGSGKLDYMGNQWARNPTSAFIYEVFKVEDHHITRVMAVIVKGPYKGATGWE